MVDRVLLQLTRAHESARSHPPAFGADGVARACDLVFTLIREVQTGHDRLFVDPEFGVVLATESARRFLQAMGCPQTAPRCWQAIVASRADPTVDADRFTAAAGAASLRHDLAAAVVSTCTVLGTTPAAAERTDTAAIVTLVATHLPKAHLPVGITTFTAVWDAAVRLWAVRGRPAAADAHRAELDCDATRLVCAALHPDGPRR